MRKKLQPPLIIILSLTALLLLIIGSYHFAYWQRIYPGVVIASQPVGNYTLPKAEEMINQIASFPPTNLIIKSGEQQWPISLIELNFAYNAQATAQKAYLIGRTGHIWQDLVVKLKLWFYPQDVNLEFSLDQSLLENKIAVIASQIFVPAVEPTIKIEKNQISIQSGQEGREINKRKLLSIITYQFSQNTFEPIEIPIVSLSPTLTEEQIKKTQAQAEKILGKKLTLVNQPHSAGASRGKQEQWLLQEEELISFLAFDVDFDREKISQWTANLAKSINRPAENTIFRFQGNRVVQFLPAREGQVLDEEKTISLITKSLEKLAAEKTEVTSQLPVTTILPQITTADVNSLGIHQLIGSGISFFRGSISNRLHNISLASTKLNGLLIAPEEIFSFNQSLGETSIATGFKPAYIIKEGRTILGDGGGVCQVSTTLFRAALDAGLPIIERQAHAYRVSYYEQDYQPGFDATVFEPSPDLKFKNDTPAHILIQTVFNKEKGQLTFELYGSSDGRVVQISKAKIWEQIPPPPDLYIDDPSLPAGQIKQIEKKIWGAKVSFDYKVTRNYETLQERTFYSVYQPWQAVFSRSTKSVL